MKYFIIILSTVFLSGCMTVRLGLPTRDRADNPMANREFRR